MTNEELEGKLSTSHTETPGKALEGRQTRFHRPDRGTIAESPVRAFFGT